MNWLGGLWSALAQGLVSLIQGWLKTREDEKLGADDQALKDKGAADDVAIKAVDAGRAAGRAVDTDGGLRQYEHTDPNDRDNA